MKGYPKRYGKSFVRLFKDGLLYRGERLINWCPRCLTALSDIEVEREDVTGKLYTIRYVLTDDPTHYLLVATTRPETLLAICRRRASGRSALSGSHRQTGQASAHKSDHSHCG